MTQRVGRRCVTRLTSRLWPNSENEPPVFFFFFFSEPCTIHTNTIYFPVSYARQLSLSKWDTWPALFVLTTQPLGTDPTCSGWQDWVQHAKKKNQKNLTAYKERRIAMKYNTWSFVKMGGGLFLGKWSGRSLARQISSMKSCRSILNGSGLNRFLIGSEYCRTNQAPFFIREKGKNSQGLVVKKLLWCQSKSKSDEFYISEGDFHNKVMNFTSLN